MAAKTRASAAAIAAGMPKRSHGDIASPATTSTGTEVSGGSYTRPEVVPADAAFAAPVGNDGHTENLADIDFAAPTANWGAIVGSGIYTASSGGNLWFFDDFPAVNVNNGDAAPKIAAGQLDYTFNE